MALNPMQKKVRNSFILGILVMLIIVLIVIGIVFVFVVKPKLEAKKEEEEQIVTYAYRLKAGINIESAQEINSAMVEIVEIPVNTQVTDFVQAKYRDAKGNLKEAPFAAGYRSKIALQEGTILTYSMLYTEEQTPDSLRFVEYNMITMPTTLAVGDYIDIRLRLPNGQDLIVTSKKEIISIYGQTVGLNLTEDEILILNSAIVEAYIMMGSSELYMATYVEPGLQTASVYTYMPTNEVITLINMDQNIVSEARNGLAKLYSRQDVTDVRGQVSSATTKYAEDSKENIEAGIQEQIEAARKAREDYLAELEGY